MIKLSYLLACLLTLSVNIAANVHADHWLAYVEPKPYYTGPGGETEEDLQNKIVHKITTGWFAKDFSGVRVEVKDNVVVLKGTVKTDADKKRLVDAILGINGVGHIDATQIIIEEPALSH